MGQTGPTHFGPQPKWAGPARFPAIITRQSVASQHGAGRAAGRTGRQAGAGALGRGALQRACGARQQARGVPGT